MKLFPMDLGVCGVEQLLYAGSVGFDTSGVSTGVVLSELPEHTIITKAVAVVGEGFNAATTNVLTIGVNDDANDLLATGDITEGTVGSYVKNTFVECKEKAKIKAKYTQTGTAATKGKADVYIGVVRTPE